MKRNILALQEDHYKHISDTKKYLDKKGVKYTPEKLYHGNGKNKQYSGTKFAIESKKP